MTSDTVYNVVGVLGGSFLASALVPQVYRVTVRQKAADISHVYQAVFLTGMVMFLVFYGYYELWELFFPTLTSMVLQIYLVVFKLRLERCPRRHAAAAPSTVAGETPGEGATLDVESSERSPLLKSA
ncbi:unnamed protein product [Ectocarpus sp. 12 AP-2014]